MVAAKHLVNVTLAYFFVPVHQVARQGEYYKCNPEYPIQTVNRHAHHNKRYAENGSIDYYSHISFI